MADGTMKRGQIAVLPPICRGDSALRERAKDRQAGRLGRASKLDTRTYRCPHCGRTWHVESVSLDGNSGRAAGFMSTASQNHAATCEYATPEERRAIARLDMRRWAAANARPGHGLRMKQSVVIDFQHPGFGNEPIFTDPAFERFGCSLAPPLRAPHAEVQP